MRSYCFDAFAAVTYAFTFSEFAAAHAPAHPRWRSILGAGSLAYFMAATERAGDLLRARVRAQAACMPT